MFARLPVFPHLATTYNLAKSNLVKGGAYLVLPGIGS